MPQLIRIRPQMDAVCRIGIREIPIPIAYGGIHIRTEDVPAAGQGQQCLTALDNIRVIYRSVPSDATAPETCMMPSMQISASG